MYCWALFDPNLVLALALFGAGLLSTRLFLAKILALFPSKDGHPESASARACELQPWLVPPLQCDQIRRNFAIWATFYWPWRNFTDWKIAQKLGYFLGEFFVVEILKFQYYKSTKILPKSIIFSKVFYPSCWVMIQSGILAKRFNFLIM